MPLVLLAILALALVLRLRGIAFGLPAVLDPDELMFELGAYKMVAGGRLNPEWFGHPATTTMYVLGLVDAVVFGWGWLAGTYGSPADFAEAIFLDPGIVILPGRIAMALFGVASVALLWRLGRDLAGPTAGLVAAAILAVSPVHVAWSQIIRSDIMATVFLTATMLAALALLREGRMRDLVWATLFAALAIASKWPFAVGLLAIAGALAVRLWRREDAWKTTLARGTLALVLTAAFLILVSPYLVIDHRTVIDNLQGEAQVRHIGATGGGFWANLWFYLSGPMWDGLGPAALLLALGGLVRRDTRTEFWIVAGLPGVAMLMLISLQSLVWERWAIALIPVLALAAGMCIARGFDIVRSAPSRVVAAVVPAGVVMLLGPPLWTAHRASVERSHDNRRLATDWARTHLPAGSTVLVEHFAFDLATSDLKILFPIGVGGCFDARELLAGRIDYKQIDSLRGGRSNLDYGAVPEAKVATCAADYAIFTEYARYAAERKTYPLEYARYRRLLDSAGILARFPAVPGYVGGRPEVVVAKLGGAISTIGPGRTKPPPPAVVAP